MLNIFRVVRAVINCMLGVRSFDLEVGCLGFDVFCYSLPLRVVGSPYMVGNFPL